ncbi:hypothetical protein ZIOFF_024277 [Zingiber officinale]|uniref:Uncharacterized protein n=1 Tax=Zingiber officinale TaxID=94328 RepID=A0A8J5GTY7_ZINOF|nr:hypothetical protein ZIOFF_024277 [Zingiber officinale]
MLLLLRAMVGFQTLHLKPTKHCTKLKKKKEIIVEMLVAGKPNEKKGAVEEHNLLLLKLNCTNLPLGISQANLNCITKTLSGTSSVLEIENILMALEQIAQLEMATGKDKDVVHNSSTIGMRKSLFFHDVYVVCKIFQKSGSGPKIVEQYGAPFNEEDYNDDTTTEDSFPLGPESLDCQTTLFNPITEQAMTSAVIETSSNYDLLEFDGILLDEFLEFLNNSPPRENAHHEVPDSVVPNKTVDETSSIGPEEISTELENIYSHETNSNNKASGDNLEGIALSSMLLELENDQYLELTYFWFTEDNSPCQSTMLIDALTSMNNNLIPMPNSVPCFSNDGSTSMHYASYAGDEITNGQPTITVQIEDVGRFAYHPDALEFESLLASFTNPFL